MYRSEGRVTGAVVIQSCGVDARRRPTMAGRMIPLTPSSRGLFAHDLAASHAVSGGPMWIEENGARTLIGIHARAIDEERRRAGVLLDDVVRAQVAQWMNREMPPFAARAADAGVLGRSEEFPMSYLNDAGEPPVAAGASGPIFDLVCAPGRCAPFADNQCRTVLRRATLDAIALANNAADKLSADNPDPETTRLFRAFFGHDPSRPIPWADNQPSRLSVASRFRSCARELNGGRRTQYSCVCAANAPAGRRGETHSPLDVRLCPAFWRPAGLPVSDRSSGQASFCTRWSINCSASWGISRT